jgi:uncharacterized protein YciI
MQKAVVLLLLLFPLAAHAQNAAKESLYIVQFTTGDAWVKDKAPGDQRFFADHSANLRRLRSEGKLLIGARYADKGMIVLKAPSEQSVKEEIDKDPSVQNHVFNAAIHPFSAFYDGCIERPKTQSADETLVRQTVETYLHGLKFNDVGSLKKAFHPEAKLFFAKKDGSLGQLTQEQWYSGFEASAGKEEEGRLQIVSVDITGNSASVKVREEYPKSVYTDYVSLVRLAGEWKIVNKIFVAELRKQD